MDLVLDRLGPELVGRPVDRPALHSAAGQPGAEGAVVVVASRVVVAVAVLGRLAAELPAPDDQRAVEQPTLLQIREQGREGLVHFLGLLRQACFEILMMVPAAGPDLDETHAAFDQPPGDEHLFALGAVAVELADVRGLLVHVEGVRGLGLHSEGDFVGLKTRFERGFLLQVLRVHLVQLLHVVQRAALFGGRGVLVPDVLDHLENRLRGRVDARAGVDPRKKGGLPIRGSTQREATAGPQRDEARKILVLRPETIDGP